MEKIISPIELYRFEKSGHSHKVYLFLSILNLQFINIDIDIFNDKKSISELLKLNPFGFVPVIRDNDVVIADSHAILVYLALTYADKTWYPQKPEVFAKVQQWLSVSAGPLAFGPCAARLITVFGMNFDAEEVIARSHALLTVMDGELSQRPFLVCNHPTIADIANYTYIAHAPEGNVSLQEYAYVRAWLARIEALPGFVPMPKTAVGLAT